MKAIARILRSILPYKLYKLIANGFVISILTLISLMLYVLIKIL